MCWKNSRIFITCIFIRIVNPQLFINVRNQGGDIMHENITANVSEDTITLDFSRLDGVLITQLIDFTNEVEVMKIVIPGEEELGQSSPQILCFVMHGAQADFIAPDAMAKLRQKNPGTIRVAEEDRGWRQTTATGWGGRALLMLSTPGARLCLAAREKVYVRATDLARWSPRPGMEQTSLSSLVIPFPENAESHGNSVGSTPVPTCTGERNLNKECICHLEVCVNWYPCGLKYCKGKPQGGLSYRCGIKTCSRCYRYHYYVRRKDNCMWDE